jgi:uncharacterized protein YprB with RNaseH-like and TPR domain
MSSLNMDLKHWLSSTFQNTLNILIMDLEKNIEKDLINFNIDRQIKDKKIPQIVSKPLLKQHTQILFEKLHQTIDNQIDNLKSTNLITKITTPYSLMKTPIRTYEKPRSLLHLNSHYEIYNQLKNIQQDIIFIDTETDGLPPNCNILSICMTSINLKENPQESENYQEEYFFIKPNENYKINYKSKAYQINKITQENIDNGFYLSYLAEYIIEKLSNKIVIGYNIKTFDIPILRKNLAKHNYVLPKLEIIDLYNIQIRKTKNDLSSTLRNLNCYPIDENLRHNATADTDACIRLFAAQTKKYNLPKSKEEYIRNKNNLLQNT